MRNEWIIVQNRHLFAHYFKTIFMHLKYQKKEIQNWFSLKTYYCQTEVK